MPSPEELARQKIDALLQQCGWIGDQTLKDWSSSDKTSSEGEARRVSACSANGASRAAVRHRHAFAWAKPEKPALRVNQFQQFVTPDDGRKFTELYNGARGDGATWTLDPKGSRAGGRVINVQHLQWSSRGRCDIDGKPGG